MGYDTQGSECSVARTAPDEWDGTDRTPRKSADLTRALEALGHAQRRAALAVLRDAGRLSLDFIARAVVARRDAAVIGEDSPQLAETRLQLHHVHLPKLDAAGVLTYDPDERCARCIVEDDLVFRLLDDVAPAP